MTDPSAGENQVLFGCDPTPGIVAAEIAGRFIRLFIRNDRGVFFKDDPFRPFVLLYDPSLLDRFPGNPGITTLGGSGDFRHMASFRDWQECLSARDFLSKTTGKTPSAANAPYLFISDPVHQHLLVTGKTMFKGLEFRSLNRLAIDIETYCSPGFEFSNPNRDSDLILSIAVADEAGYEEVLSGRETPEGRMLERLGEIIRERDPDVIEGHNLFRFDLEYVKTRANRLGVKLRWGRDGSEPRVRSSRFTVAERVIDYPRWNIYGRQVVDTYFLLQIHDVSSRELPGYGLKAAAAHFGLSAPDRTYVDGSRISRIHDEDHDLLLRYNLDDARETLALSRLLSQPYFLQTRMFPYSYQNCILRGNATKINSLFLREYLRRAIAIPKGGSEQTAFEGGFTAVYEYGVLEPIVHCDVASLYPSLIVVNDLQPRKDTLGLFLPMLRDLREFRLAAKRKMKEAEEPQVREHYDALQQTFKVLINSFYGYLGTTLHNFSDPRLAAEVTRLGRETITTMLGLLRKKGARAVEIDTDGIYFIPPPDVRGKELEDRLVRELSESLPDGVDVEVGGRYRAMFSYKIKNYALISYDGRVTLRGSALRSRGMERYLREFMKETIRLVLMNEREKVETLYEEYLGKLKEHRFDISWLARTETLRESPAGYQQKVSTGRRNPSAAFEIALASPHEYRAGDQISYYVTGTGSGVTAYESCRAVHAYDLMNPDENIDFYIRKLEMLKNKFVPSPDPELPLFA